MRYRGSEAFDLDREGALGRPRAGEDSSLVVVEGGHLDAEARRGVSREFLRRARIAVVAVVVLCALGALRVALTAGTVTLLQNDLELRSQIEEARDLNEDLRAERSLLSSGKRITSIATEVYGMVYNPATTSLEVGDGSVDAAQDGD